LSSLSYAFNLRRRALLTTQDKPPHISPGQSQKSRYSDEPRCSEHSTRALPPPLYLSEYIELRPSSTRETTIPSIPTVVFSIEPSPPFRLDN
jgi:hypothetical protein